jgi:CCR4-NOT transcription complex subunit 2
MEQITRPVQQLLSSPVDNWGLQALLRDIRLGTGDRAMMIHGEDLNQMGINLEQAEYVSRVTRPGRSS